LTQIGAALAYFGTVSLFVIANDRTTAANAIFLQYTAPIYVALLAGSFLGEKTRRIDWVCIGLALFGVALFFRDDFDARGLVGIIVALASGVSFASMVMLLRREKDASPESSLLLGNLLTAAVGLPFGWGHNLSGHEWAILGVLGAVQLGIPYILYSIAIKRVTALEAILIPMLEPILNPIWVALTKGEVPGAWSLIGGGLVLGAVLIRSLAR
jgi:drug/metabolite transporter (DMT)-like permease